MFELIVFILILSFLVIIHEFGHFFAALWAKIRIEEFGLGYPPRAKVLFKWLGVPFSINWIPFGGFVKMEGEENVPESGKNELSQTKNSSKDGLAPFYQRSISQRLVVILAGVAVNALFGVIAFSIFYSFKGIPEPLNQPRIAALAPGSPAEQAGLPTEVNIISLTKDEEIIAVESIEEVISIVKDWSGETVIMTVSGSCEQYECDLESTESFEVYLRTPEETPSEEGSIGISFATTVLVPYPWYEMPFRGVVVGFKQAFFLGLLIIQMVGSIGSDIFQKLSVPDGVAGPVGIVAEAKKSNLFEQGWLEMLHFSGMLSVNLAIMNLLPIPALDGGRAVFVLLEKVIGKRRISTFEGYANYGGFVILLSLIVLVTVRDIWRIVAGL